MPHTYPRPLGRNSNTLNHIPQRPPLSPNQSRYLSPNQNARIESWRSHATASISPTSATSSRPPSESSRDKVRSAPASLNISPDKSPASSSPGICASCAARSACSCSTTSPRRPKGYYKKSKKSQRTMSASAPITPQTSMTQLAQAAQAVDKRGMPSMEQIQAYQAGAPPRAQFGGAPTVPIPDAAVAMPKAQPHTLPRIAGARDPISQNYYRQMFPPAGGPFAPGPAMFGVPGGPWGF